ncbi:NHLP leader peptide family RiPP precursor [Frigoriglobus tundricola]|uniref:NHLP leader peptide family RiPP precursor n=1 Tax=Frigoriglobus tundricola TaxID=2774151 RepID=UPI00148ECE95|nr:NHLP leader peptide family RiPP precursor [Frigoriglobus tundricola]
MTQTLSQNRAWSQIVATAWADEEFKARLLADPRAVLAEHGIDVPEGIELAVVEDTETVHHIVLPPSPAGDLADEELVGSAGADSYSGFSGYCGRCGCACRCGRCE